MGHFRDEIFEQPASLGRLLAADRGPWRDAAAAIRGRGVHSLVIAARGTSDNAARYAGYLFGAANRLPVGLALPSLFTLYAAPPALAGTCVLGISQSGASSDLVAVLEEARRQGALTIALTNRPAAPLARAAEHVLDLQAGEEHAVAASKTYTAELAALALLSATLAGDAARLAALETLPAAVAQTLGLAPAIALVAERFRFLERCVVLGRGYNYATAFEVALKLKETCYLIAEPYSSADFLHGPMALVERDFPVLAVAPDGSVADSLREVLAAAAARGAELCVISDRADLAALGRTQIRLPAPVPEWLSPVTAAAAGQLFALALAETRGLDPDRPRGLAKVTSTV
ncbi:MAG TPA: SIS domain-containing protein [Polyangia bacterium]|jgi:glucosamine--fructose-6-phosphate aminotransferase (isomerizing)